VEDPFDDFTRALGSNLPRRRLLGLLAGTVAASVLGVRPASAQGTNSCGERCQPKGGGCVRCGQRCRTDADCADDTGDCIWCRCDANFSGMICRSSRGRRADCTPCL
jgi:hypothetical protein